MITKKAQQVHQDDQGGFTGFPRRKLSWLLVFRTGRTFMPIFSYLDVNAGSSIIVYHVVGPTVWQYEQSHGFGDKLLEIDY